ncbi:hypothetical protein V8E52_004575 [Russula decolorans]
MSRLNRHSSERPHGHPNRRVTSPQPRASSPYYTNNYNQSARGTSPAIGWSPPSSATQGPSAAYPPQGGRSPPYGGIYRSDNSAPAYPTAVRQQSNATPSVSQDECHAWFFAIDQDGDGTLSSEELRHALLNEGGLQFSAATVRYLMSIFDRDRNGVITFEEFEPLWVYMTVWRQMFDSFDADRDGRIDAIELGRALDHYRLHVGRHVLDMLVKKYGMVPPRNRLPGYGNQPQVQPRPQMDLDHFVCASVVVREMCEMYEKCKAGGRPQISRDEFLLAVISLP